MIVTWNGGLKETVEVGCLKLRVLRIAGFIPFSFGYTGLNGTR